MTPSTLIPAFGALLLVLSLALASLKPGAAELGEPELYLARSGPAVSPSCASLKVPKRVVSAALLTDELLLGVLPLDRWVAVSYVVDWPGSTPLHDQFPTRLARIGGGAEQILSQRPDLVLFSDYNSAAVMAQLTQAGICVRHIKSPQTFDELLSSWLMLGRTVGALTQAKVRVREAERRLSRLKAHARKERPRVLLLQGKFGYGRGSLQSDCLRLVGFDNVLDDPGYGTTPPLNVEHLLGLKPDVIFVAADVTEPGAAKPNQLPPDVPWHLTAAYASGRIYAVPAPWMAAISHQALLACEAYAELGRERRP